MHCLWMEQVSVMKTPKVFCIGMHKTGTTSVGMALKTLGYTLKSTHSVNCRERALGMIDQLLANFDAVEDHPWSFVFRELDERCPGSRFILTTRHPESWYASVLRHFGDEVTQMRQWIYGPQYGAPQGNKDIYLNRFGRHNSEVREYFSNRPNALLEIDLSDGNNWTRICEFLSETVPSEKFPHANKSATYKEHQNLAS